MKKKWTRIVILVSLVMSLVVGLFLIDKETKFFQRAFGKKANLVVDVGSSYQSKTPSWKNLSQGGEEKERMLQAVVNEVNALKPEYIRIDHVFDFYDLVSRDQSGGLSFNWTKLDLTINDILATGAKPFISLSYTPSVISSGGTTDLPKDWGEWEQVVGAVVQHYSGDYGLENVYYEVWNEPDLLGDFKTYGSKNYLDLYTHAIRGAQQAKNVKPFKIGGPATTALYKGWIKNLLQHVKDNNLRLDFISWHKYSYDLSDFERDANDALLSISKSEINQDIELIITEIGHNSEKDSGYDNSFSAIHTLATTALLEGKVDRIFAFEIKDGPDDSQYHGGWGLLTHDKHGTPVKKPRYFALQYLNQITGKRMNVAGQGTWVKAFAKKDGDTTKLLVVNYDSQGKHYEAVPIKFVNIPFKSFTYKRTNYSGEVSEQSITIEGTTWETTEEFNPNTAAIIEVVEN